MERTHGEKLRYSEKPAVIPLVESVIEGLAKLNETWQNFPTWCKCTTNATYLVIYKKIANKFQHSVEFVNE